MIILLLISFGKKGKGSDHKFRFTPNDNDGTSDTHIFDDEGYMKVREVRLPKSGAISYNLYKITRMDISKALKHPEENGVVYDEASIDHFMKRTALYIRSLLGNANVDIITYPQSSSDFNERMVSYLLRLYPQSEGIKIYPNLLSKNVRNIFVNTDIAHEIGLTDDEIHYLQRCVERWKSELNVIC